MKKSNISKLAYELYKLNWKYDHNITVEAEEFALKDYFNGLVDEPSDYTFANYLEEFGYEGQIYVSYEEFCDMEYHDKDYISSLLKDEELISLYYSDIEDYEEE